MIGFDPDAVSKLTQLSDDHMLGYMVSVGRETEPAWPRGERLADSEVVIHDKFPR